MSTISEEKHKELSANDSSSSLAARGKGHQVRIRCERGLCDEDWRVKKSSVLRPRWKALPSCSEALNDALTSLSSVNDRKLTNSAAHKSQHLFTLHKQLLCACNNPHACTTKHTHNAVRLTWPSISSVLNQESGQKYIIYLLTTYLSISLSIYLDITCCIKHATSRGHVTTIQYTTIWGKQD